MTFRSIKFCSRLALLALLAGWASTASADRIVTLSGTEVRGTIVSEDADSVEIRTDDFGTLRFRKVNIDRIERRGAARSPQHQQGTGSRDPFAMDQSDPFASDFNPFDASSDSFNPFDPAPGGPSRSERLGATEVDDATSVGLDLDELMQGPVGERPHVPPPTVPGTWDAVLFSIPEDATVRVRAQPSETTLRPVSAETTLRNGAEVATDDTFARIVLKDGVTVLRVAPRSAVRLVSSTESSSEIQVLRGSVWAEVSPTRSGLLRVATGPMTLESRGGVFRVMDAVDLGMHVAVTEGEATVASRHAQMTTTVKRGQMLFVIPNGAISAPVEISRAVRREDAQFDDLPAQWWLQTGRLHLTGGVVQRQFVSLNELPGRVREVADAFIRYAEDTGHVPDAAEGFSVLRENIHGRDGWSGPYLEGPLPPLDSWGRPLRYTLRDAGGSNKVGIVYSKGENNIDNGGDPSADIPEMILYYQIDRIARAAR